MYNSGNSSKNVTGSSVVDGTLYTVDIADDAVTADKLANTVNADIATGVTASTTAGAALPKAGGTMTGNIVLGANTIDGLAINTTAPNNIGLGTGAVDSITTGAQNVGVGDSALTDTTTGYRNTAVGTSSLGNNTTGFSNVSIGRDSLVSNTTGYVNVAVGEQSLMLNTTGVQNVAIGYMALTANVASNGTAVGYRALWSNTSGARNVSSGAFSSYFNTTGSYNTANGYSALKANTTGNYNTATGLQALLNNTTGNNNTALGANAGDLITTGTDNIIIGNGSDPSIATAVGECTLGSTAITNLRCNDTTISALSDERDKKNIVDIPLGLDFINTLRPVSFDWERRDGSMKGKKDFGFIAQELKIAQDATPYAENMRLVHTDNPDKWEADPMKTFPVMMKAIQELSAMVETLQTEVNTLKGV